MSMFEVKKSQFYTLSNEIFLKFEWKKHKNMGKWSELNAYNNLWIKIDEDDTSPWWQSFLSYQFAKNLK